MAYPTVFTMIYYTETVVPNTRILIMIEKFRT